MRLCLGLVELGIARGDRVAIMGDPCPEWCYADLAALCAGAITYGIYPTSSVSQVRYVLENGGAKVVVAENQEHVDKLLPLADEFPGLLRIVVADTRGMIFYRHPKLMTLAELAQLAERRSPQLFDELVRRGSADDVMNIVYTSGTSGPPKAAMVTHRNSLTALAGSYGEIFPGLAREEHRSVSYLSMAHMLERLMTGYFPLVFDVVPHFGESIDELSQTLYDVQPTFLCSVPRVWEKIASQVLVGVQSSSPLKRRMYRWAMRIGTHYREAHWAGRASAARAIGYFLARQLVFRHILRRVGFAHLQYACSAGAALPPRVQGMWQTWGVDLVNLYGATEAGGTITSQRPGFPRPGDVGYPAAANEVRLAEDGEVLVRGSGVFPGYWNDPTASAQAKEGEWLRVGEIGELGPKGELRLIDRKRDIMVTAGGKNIAPTNIESALKASPYISEAVVFAEGRRYPVALIEIDAATVSEWARAQRIAYGDFASLVGQPAVLALIQRELERANQTLARVEQVKKFRLLPKELDPENEGDPLTATRKIKRKVMYERFKDLVESMYKEEAIHEEELAVSR